MADGRIKLGQIAFVEKGVYDVAVTYKRFHFVTTGDSTYLSLKDDNVGNPTTDTLSWLCLADGKPALAAAANAIIALADANAAIDILNNFLSAHGASDAIINTWRDVEAFLAGVTDTTSLTKMLADQKKVITDAYIKALEAKLSLAGGALAGQILSRTFTNAAWQALAGAFCIEEMEDTAADDASWGRAPSFAFHWKDRYAKRLGLRSDGQVAVDDVPLSLEGHTHDVLRATDERNIKPNGTGIGRNIKAIKAYFVHEKNLGLSAFDSQYCDFLILDTYPDASAGRMNAIAFKKTPTYPDVYFLSAGQDDAAWGPPVQIKHSGNYLPSDERLKNITQDPIPWQEILENVLPESWEWKNQSEQDSSVTGNKKKIGYISQKIEKYAPWMVGKKRYGGEFDNFEETQMIPLLHLAHLDNVKRISDLEKQNKALIKRLEVLEQKAK